MSRVSSVQEYIIEYLRENGASYINELYNSSGVSKDTFYKALNALIESGSVVSYREGKRRYVKLVSVVPSYLKHLIFTTLAVIVMMLVSLAKHEFNYVDFGSPYPVSYPDPGIFYMMVMFLLGLWTGVIFFRDEDLESAYYYLKIKMRELVSLIRR